MVPFGVTGFKKKQLGGWFGVAELLRDLPDDYAYNDIDEGEDAPKF